MVGSSGSNERVRPAMDATRNMQSPNGAVRYRLHDEDNDGELVHITEGTQMAEKALHHEQ